MTIKHPDLKNYEKEQILALSESGYSNVKIGKLHGIHEKSVRNVKNEYKEQLEQVPTDCNLLAKKASISDIKEHFKHQCATMLDRFAQGVTKEKIDKASLRDLAISYGIFFDKMAISSDMATQNVSVQHSLVSQVRKIQEAE